MQGPDPTMMEDPNFRLAIVIAGMFVVVLFNNQWEKWRGGYSCILCGARRPEDHLDDCPRKEG
jgi:hypothetical protein